MDEVVDQQAPVEEQQPVEAPPAEAPPESQGEAAPAEEPASAEVSPLESAPVEPQPEAAPAAAEPEPAPAEPAEEQSPLDLLFDRYEARLAALEASAHSGHNLDVSAIDQIVALVLDRIGAGIKKRLLG